DIGLPSAILIAVGGFIALIGATLLGTGTYAAQIGSEAASPLASLFTPFQSWTVAGFGLLFGCWARGGVRRRTVALLAIAAIGVELFVGIAIVGRLAPALSYSLAIAFGATIDGFVRLRLVAIAGLALVIVWPHIYSARNDVRVSAGGKAVASAQALHSAEGRLQLDTELADAQWLTFPAEEKPGPLSILRYGLIPRALDPGRPTLSTGAIVGGLTGHGTLTYYSLTILGSTYLFGGGPLTV